MGKDCGKNRKDDGQDDDDSPKYVRVRKLARAYEKFNTPVPERQHARVRMPARPCQNASTPVPERQHARARMPARPCQNASTPVSNG